MKFHAILVSLLASYATGAAVPEAEPEADAEMLEQRAIGSYCQQDGAPDKGTCQKESWCKAAAQVGIVSTGDCPYDPNDVKLDTALDLPATNAASIDLLGATGPVTVYR
ncbi:hypothetical protein IFR04_003163 [Cadophora malorum]|uniref:Uncharacterized protein n=1 Tax=Cadophora malorum TaxID=108018 RepID=A0A8H7WFF6_9HELO|nr:hypothetical protein IFR04_003163 [Cadophora malorum]